MQKNMETLWLHNKKQHKDAMCRALLILMPIVLMLIIVLIYKTNHKLQWATKMCVWLNSHTSVKYTLWNVPENM